jgi:hypothetical protein
MATQTDEIWYYRMVPYLSGKNKGKLHYEYNWIELSKEINRVLDWFESREIQPTIRQIHYHFVQLKPARIPNVKKCYQKLDEFITTQRERGYIEWGRIQEDQRITDNDYLPYWHTEEFIDNRIDKLKASSEDYYIPKWYKQPKYAEVYVEKKAAVNVFGKLTKDWEINVRHDKGFGSPEAIFQNCKEVVKLMYQEDIQKEVTAFYGGDMDPSGDSMDMVLKNQLDLFAEYDFGFEDYNFGYPLFDDNGERIYRNYRFGYAKVVRLFVTQDQISEFNIPVEFDAEISAKLLGTSIANGDEKDKKGDHRTKAYIERYRKYMKPGDILPPMSELDAMLTTNELLDKTKAILDTNIKPLFNDAIHKREVTDKLQPKQDEVREFLKKKVKFTDEYDPFDI